MSPLPRTHPARSQGNPPPRSGLLPTPAARGARSPALGQLRVGYQEHRAPLWASRNAAAAVPHYSAFRTEKHLGSATYRCPAPHIRSRGRRRRARRGRARPAASAGATAARRRGGRGATAWPMCRRPAAHMRRGPAGSAAPQPLRATARAQRRRMKEPQRRGAGRGEAEREPAANSGPRCRACCWECSSAKDDVRRPPLALFSPIASPGKQRWPCDSRWEPHDTRARCWGR